MEECLITDKICSANNKKCKLCKLEQCKEVLNMIQEYEDKEDRYKKTMIKKQLPEQCKRR